MLGRICRTTEVARRGILLSLASLLLTGCTPSPRAAWESLEQEFWQAHSEYRAGNSTDPAKWEEALRRCADAEKYAAKALSLAKAHPKTDLADKELWWIINYFSEGSSCKEAVETYARDFPEIFAIRCRSVVLDRNAFIDPSLQAMARWSPDPETRGRATLARARFRHSGMHDDATAEKLYQEVIAKFADVKMSQASAATLGDIARDGLRYLGSPVPAESGWRAGEKAPPFQATTTDGKTVQVPGSYKGKVLLIDFWATWCGPCVKEIPNVADAYEKHHLDGLEILSVSLDQANAGDVFARFGRSHRMPWPQIYDGQYVDSPIARLFRITGVEHPTGIPYALVVDGDTGYILAAGQDARGPKLATAIEKALVKMKSNPK